MMFLSLVLWTIKLTLLLFLFSRCKDLEIEHQKSLQRCPGVEAYSESSAVLETIGVQLP